MECGVKSVKYKRAPTFHIKVPKTNPKLAPVPACLDLLRSQKGVRSLSHCFPQIPSPKIIINFKCQKRTQNWSLAPTSLGHDNLFLSVLLMKEAPCF